MSDVPSNTAAPAAPVSNESLGNNNTQSIESQGLEASGDEFGGDLTADLKDQAVNGTPKEKVEAKKMLKKLKIKFNGREYEEDLPFEIPDDEASVKYMRDKLQMDRLARSKAQDYSTLEREVQDFVNELKKNPKKALSNPAIGMDLKKLAQEIIEEEIENSTKSPELLAKEQLEAELKALKEEREQEKTEAQRRELEALQEKEFERYDQAVSKALEGSKLPKSPYIVKKMADMMLMGLQEGLDVQPEDVIPLIEAEMQNDLKEMFAVMPDEVIEALVGKDVIGRIRKKSIAKGKGIPPTPLKAAVKDVGTTSVKKEPAKKMSYKDFFK